MRQVERAAPRFYPDTGEDQLASRRLHYLRVVLRWKRWIIAFVAVCVAVTYLVSTWLTPVFEAKVLIDVDVHAAPTQEKLIQSDAVLRPVAEHFKLLDRESQLQNLNADSATNRTNAPIRLKQLRVESIANTSLIQISYRSRDPRLAADVCNAIAESYRKQIFGIQLPPSGALPPTPAEGTVANGPTDGIEAVRARLLRTTTQYTAAQEERARAETAFHGMQGEGIPASKILDANPELKRVSDRLTGAKQHLAEVSATYGTQHPEYQKASSELADAQRQFNQVRHDFAKAIQAEYVEALNREQALQTALAAATAEYQGLQSKSPPSSTDAGPKPSPTAESRSQAQSSSVRIADLARPPDVPVFPNKQLNVLLAFLLSSILAIAVTVLSDLFDGTVRDPERTARVSHTSVLGTLPAVKEMPRLPFAARRNDTPSIDVDGNGSVNLVRYANRQASKPYKNGTPIQRPNSSLYEGFSSYEESIRAVKQSILTFRFDGQMRTLMLASASPGEGKSTATVHLAIAHAEQGNRTLIIDGDLRRPTIHKKLGLDGMIGLANVLLGQISWRDALLETPRWPQLDVMPAGTVSRRASDLIGSPITEILERVSREYDLVLIDSPPLLGFAEAMQLATAVDGVVLIARAGQTNQMAVANAIATLHRVRANLIGLVLNEVDSKNTSGYYYHYKDYRKYYTEERGRGSQTI